MFLWFWVFLFFGFLFIGIIGFCLRASSPFSGVSSLWARRFRCGVWSVLLRGLGFCRVFVVVIGFCVSGLCGGFLCLWFRLSGAGRALFGVCFLRSVRVRLLGLGVFVGWLFRVLVCSGCLGWVLFRVVRRFFVLWWVRRWAWGGRLGWCVGSSSFRVLGYGLVWVVGSAWGRRRGGVVGGHGGAGRFGTSAVR